MFPLADYQDEDVQFQLTQTTSAPLNWRALHLNKTLPHEYLLQQALAASGKPNLAVSEELGRLLGSPAFGKADKKALLNFCLLGGIVNHPTRRGEEKPRDRLANVLLCHSWQGGNEGLELLHDLDTLPMLLVTSDSNVSDSGVRRLRARFPNVIVGRTPRHLATGRPANFEVINCLDEDVILYGVARNGKLKRYETLRPQERILQESFSGHRWVALAKGEPVAQYVVSSILTWEIN